jgi:large subunit ribosomal protein L33
MPRELITLACTECKRRSYTTTKNKRLSTERLELKKYCRFERKRTPHREVK